VFRRRARSAWRLRLARTAQFGPQVTQFPPQLFELLAEVGVGTAIWRAFATAFIASSLFSHLAFCFAHQTLGPLTGFMSEVTEARRFEMTGGDLQMFGPFRWGKFPLSTRAIFFLTLKARALGTTGTFAGAVRAIAQLLQPALVFVDGVFGRFDFLPGGLAFNQLAPADLQFVDVPFDLVHLPFAHLLHPRIGAHVIGPISTGTTITGTASRGAGSTLTIVGTTIFWATVARAAIIGTAIVGSACLRSTTLGGASIRAPILEAATFTRSPFAWGTTLGPAHVRAGSTWAAIPPASLIRVGPILAPITRTTITGAGFIGATLTRCTAVLDELLFGGEFGFSANLACITWRIIRQNAQQTNRHREPQIPKHVHSSRSECFEPWGLIRIILTPGTVHSAKPVRRDCRGAHERVTVEGPSRLHLFPIGSTLIPRAAAG